MVLFFFAILNIKPIHASSFRPFALSLICPFPNKCLNWFILWTNIYLE